MLIKVLCIQKKLNEIRQARRNIKHEISTMNYLINGFIRKYKKDIGNINNTVKGMDRVVDNKIYTPRVLTKELLNKEAI